MYNPGHLPQHESRFWEVRKVFTIMGFVRLFEDYAGGGVRLLEHFISAKKYHHLLNHEELL